MRERRVGASTVLILFTAGVMLMGGCATKKSMREGFAAQNSKIEDVETQVEENQKRIEETNQNLEGVKGDAAEARRIGTDANDKAGQARNRADEAYGLAKGKLLYTVVLTDTASKFGFNRAQLSDATKQELDDLASRLKAENANVYLEIQGHTDGSGPDDYNMVLGQRRAEAVRIYLNEKHGIPLHKMSVISFGKSKPVADNGTREGRAQNRRVEIRVLS